MMRRSVLSPPLASGGGVGRYDPVADIQRCPSAHQKLPSVHLGCTVDLSIAVLSKQRGVMASLAAS
jgi:hypothetical protein